MRLGAERVSFCVARVIAGSGIAAPPVTSKHARNNYAPRVNAISPASPDASIIGIANVPIAVVWLNAVISPTHQLRLRYPVRQLRRKKT